MAEINNSSRNAKLRNRIIVLGCLYAVFIPFTLAWYGTLLNIDCNNTNPSESSIAKIGSALQNKQHNCLEQTNYHWVKFFGINGAIYGTQFAALVMAIKRK